MVISDFDGGDNDLLGVPDEANAPLLVDADAPLAFACAAEFFSTQRGKRPKVFDAHHGIQQRQLLTGTFLNLTRQLPTDFSPEDSGSLTVIEAFDHEGILTKTRKPSRGSCGY